MTANLKHSLKSLLLAASATTAIVAASASASAESLPLSSLAQPTGESAIAIQVPGLDGLSPRGASLTIVFRDAGASWADAKRAGLTLAISSGGRRVAEVPLSADRWSYSIPLPSAPSGQTLQAAIVDRAGACVAGFDDALDLTASRLVIESAINSLRLDAIPTLIGPAFPAGKPLTIWSPHGLSGSGRMTAALRVAEAFALADPKRTPAIDVKKLPMGAGLWPLMGAETDRLAGPLDVLIGTADDFEGMFDDRVIAQITGPYLGLWRLDSRHALLVISGRSRADLDVASHALINPLFRFPQAGAAILAKDSAHETIPPLPGVIWGPDHSSADSVDYSFEALGYPTAHGIAQRIHIPLVSLAGQEIAADGTISVKPDFVYAPGLLPGASLQAFVGGRFVGSIPLDPNGGSTAGQEIKISLSDLAPGASAVELVPHMPAPSASCLDDKPEIPSTFRGSGTVTAPWLGGGRIRSSLSAFAVTGHLNPAAIDRNIRIVAESTEDGTIAGALNIAARMTQAAGAPIPGLTLSDNNQDATDADLVAIGTHEWAARVLKTSKTTASLPEEFPDWMKVGFGEVARVFSSGDGRDQVLYRLSQDPAAVNSAVLFGWSTVEGQSVVAAVFPRETDIEPMAKRLSSAEIWSKLAGDFVVLPLDGGPMTSEAVADPDSTATSNDPEPFSRLNAWVKDTARNAPGRLGLLAFGALVLLAFTLRISVARKRVRDAERKG